VKLYYERGSTKLYHGDCLSVMPALGLQVDSIITDPPYGLGFMGKQWDTPGSMFERKAETKNTFDHVGGNHNPCNSKDRQRTQLSEGRKFQHWCTGWAEACLQVTKPGGMLLAFGGTRTFHRLACAIEDVGWEIRDCIMWVYGSGFPKSLDISKAIDKAAGAEREVVGMSARASKATKQPREMEPGGGESGNWTDGIATAPATDAAKLWAGYGTALKPAWEPIIVAMKPLDGTFAENAQRHGVAGLAIDACRVGTSKNVPASVSRKAPANCYGKYAESGETQGIGGHDPNLGRFPANLIHDGSDEVLTGFPDCIVNKPGKNSSSQGYSGGWGSREPFGYDTTGSAARFFYCAKASRAERGKTNTHPTVKPIALMRYLCRLTKTPTGGIVIDPFAGSGSTLLAASMEGREAIGIEQDEGNCRIITDRLGVPPRESGEQEIRKEARRFQQTLFAG
jgi:site-specific DNA-methyltransferase (adenine-specific)